MFFIFWFHSLLIVFIPLPYLSFQEKGLHRCVAFIEQYYGIFCDLNFWLCLFSYTSDVRIYVSMMWTVYSNCKLSRMVTLCYILLSNIVNQLTVLNGGDEKSVGCVVDSDLWEQASCRALGISQSYTMKLTTWLGLIWLMYIYDQNIHCSAIYDCKK